MKLIIDISEETYNSIKKPFLVISGQRAYKSVITNACIAIARGIPYDKKERLIENDKFRTDQERIKG